MARSKVIAPRDIAYPTDGRHLSFFHCNVQSARNKQECITALLSDFSFDFNVIMLTETWYTCDSDVLVLPGYKSFFLNRQGRRGGGVLQLVKNNLSANLLPDFTVSSENYEVLSIACADNMFIVIYRPPTGSLASFFSFFETILCFASDNKLRPIIGGDLNINMLQQNPMAHELSLLLESNNLKNVIIEPTRITLEAETLLDLFITQADAHDIKAGVLENTVSDHLPIYMILKANPQYEKTPPSSTFMVEDVTDITLEIFRKRIASINWHDVLVSQNANEAYNIFIDKFISEYKENFKFKKRVKSKKMRKPWVTAEILEMIRKKNCMYGQFIKFKKPEDLQNFKRYRNLVTKALRNAKKEYFTNLLNDTTVKHPDQIWRTLNTLLNRSRTSNELIEVQHNGTVLNGIQLADEFNSYFTNLVKSNHDESIKEFLTMPNEKSVFLSPAEQHEIFAIFMSLSNTKSRDVDGLTIRPIKYVLDCIFITSACTLECFQTK